MDDFGLTRGNVQKYSPGVLVGNWYEDMTLREDQLKLYRGRKSSASAAGQDNGNAKATSAAPPTPAELLQQPTEITAAAGDDVCFGMPYLVVNEKTHAALAMDVLPSGSATSTVLTASSAASVPQVRSTWTLLRCKDEHNVRYNTNRPDVLHYGQRVRLANENGCADGFVYVQSSIQSGLRSSQTQYAVAALHATADNVFVVARPGAVREDVHNGGVVKVGEPVVLLHSLTNLPLACSGGYLGTSFGMEYTVTCEYVADHFSRSRSAAVTKPDNLFTFGAGDTVVVPRKSLTKSAIVAANTLSMTTGSGVTELLERIREGALQIGGRIGFRSLSIALGVACKEQRVRRMLDSNGLRSAIARLGVRLTPVEADVLMKRFDATGNNVVCAQDLLSELRGTMPQARLRSVIYAYQQLLIEGRGSVEFFEMHRLFCLNAGALPDVVDGLIQREEAVLDFENCWPGRVGCKIGTVTVDEFVEYYNDISPAEDSDERFCEAVEKAWVVPATSSYLTAGPRRVISVIHKDESVEEVPIPDSLVVDTRNTEAVRRLLVQHGLCNVREFRVSERT
ncbi:hypothetical protein ABB37_03698 [Leptomonas pyrrhocoris]|uniref:EF-hand domain-containing protein n=1 Tax=Leptomonas pyrrhocoris TaxID=157538 RepID=A0A0M9G358_LEPPY|nr:hypothetical protein ABB37_03698 [Leptomonas pyrrhocoris]XP_015659732.1 hypothetical protein ABB37_03698 [Leptomonas pyrrhocoris]KPA81292.1 hypothetical protein ABB37_03698 [Leptomonas pyrrhocoris]KPA81293.1 hypothetical protein ABB37_03698 [Leptomonas pyrrhocoris]|eukprot:XP_015659731.1 hypothetical protein ABB37_03698 [Leptomonas pyrrhocoris]